MIISERIFELMKEQKISQREFSKRTGIAQSTICDWKRKKTNPAADKLMVICEVLQISPYQLLADDAVKNDVMKDDVMKDDVMKDDAVKTEAGVGTYDDACLLERYHRLSQDDREKLLAYLQHLLCTYEAEAGKTSSERHAGQAVPQNSGVQEGQAVQTPSERLASQAVQFVPEENPPQKSEQLQNPEPSQVSRKQAKKTLRQRRQSQPKQIDQVTVKTEEEKNANTNPPRRQARRQLPTELL